DHLSSLEPALYSSVLFHFFFNDTATTEIYPLSLHDALPICTNPCRRGATKFASPSCVRRPSATTPSMKHAGCTHRRGASTSPVRSEEHTSELQSQSNLVCRLLLEKKKREHKFINICPHHQRH